MPNKIQICRQQPEKKENLTIMNTLSANFQDADGGYHEGLTLVFKDPETGIKYKDELVDPEYDYFIAKPDKRVSYNRLFIDQQDVERVTCIHRNIEGDIAKKMNLKEFFYDNIKSGNRRENQRLHTLPDVFGSDINIEDYYRFQFSLNHINDPCKVTKSFMDIEVDSINMMGDFPKPGECPINAVTLIMLDINQSFTFLLNDPSNPLIAEFKKRVEDKSIFSELKAFIKEQIRTDERILKFGLDKLEFGFLFYDNEIDLIRDIFNGINHYQPDFCLAWNMAFDIPYIIERIKVLGYDPKDIICHPDFNMKFCEYVVDHRASEFAERGDYGLISSYTTYIDQMIQYASRRKGRTRPLSFGLDHIGEIVAGVHKLDYKHITTNLADLPYVDYKTFVFYNIMDVIVQVCVEACNNDIEYMFSKAIVNNTRYSKVHRQTVYLTNRGIKEFFSQGFIMGNNVNKFNEKPDTKFPGAFVADMRRLKDTFKSCIGGIPVMIFDNVIDYDFKALYPSVIRQFNVAAHTQIGMIQILESIHSHENRQRDPQYSRGGQFVEDFQSHNWLEFCTRWLGLADYATLVKDVEQFYTAIMMPMFGLRLRNKQGEIEPMHFCSQKLPEFPMYFEDDFKVKENYVPFDYERAKEWREYAIRNINQRFR